MSDFYRGRRILITGHTGFKGMWLSKMLVMSGAEVTGYALPPAEDSVFADLRLTKDMDSVFGDVRDPDELQKVFEAAKPEIVF
ncbi:MAG: NAD-dependent epimerase/dehydratase family protein, partial [Candidatus Cloacimonetes bacterium]|nr:NAD-dependent epimerase/dehydratase family protein [Candidatus Cloacimonadota bacterium]